ncbi:MAG: family 10 glycosylhydrolase [Planctomycetes bacterium]|nr:family 10 glycosylhydrolase [Planctomycetota bacterium]
MASRSPSFCALLLLVWLAACTEPYVARLGDLPPRTGAAPAPPPPPLLREFRAAWVATVANIDWPSRRGLPTALARAELDAIVARAADLGLNALVFQVRPAADALYRSAHEPWSEWLTGAQGRPPDEDWDPLEHAIDACHRRGLELHAWFNPFRAGHPDGRSPPAANHVRSRLPNVCVKFGEYVWLDPGDARAQQWSQDVILDVVRRYDVDGVHLDDYFYPYPERGLKFDDARTFEAYQKGGGELALDDWRRARIDDFVHGLYDAVHREKAWVEVGISPFGIARPGVPRGIKAGVDQYADLYADVPRWLRTGWVDYLAPQLYWPIDQKPQSFPVLLAYWLDENVRFRNVWPGLNTNRCLEQKPPCRRTELTDQIELIRGKNQGPGHIHFSFKALTRELPHGAGALRRLYAEPAVAPPSPWLGTAAPPPPTARLERQSRGVAVVWPPQPAARFIAVQVRDAIGWRTARIVGQEVGRCELPDGYREVAVSAIGRTGVQSVVARL